MGSALREGAERWTHAARMKRFDETDLYVVITEAFCAGRDAMEVLEGALAGGVRLIQLREKDCATGELMARAVAFRERTQAADALLIIDDRVDVALACGADGVHLGQDDMPIADARRIAPELIIGSSSHDLEEAMAAQAAGASYVNIGPIFATQTKSLAMAPLGVEAIDGIAPHLRIPFTNMGGIKEHNIASIVERGGRHPAVVTAVTAADDVEQAAASLRRAMGIR